MPEQRRRALRGFIHVIVLPGKATVAPRKSHSLQKAMKLAPGDEERALAVQRASAVRTCSRPCACCGPAWTSRPGPRRPARASLSWPGTRRSAQPNRSEFQPALKQVIETNKDALTLEKARRLLGTL